jgi:hypothetical protein
MTPERLRYAQHLMADRNRSIPAICRELGGVPASTLYHCLRADGTLKAPGLAQLVSRAASGQPSPNGCSPVLVW